MHIASALEFPGRDSAVDVIVLLGKHKIIPQNLAQSFQKAPKLRNLLIHGYAKIDYRMLFRDLKADIAEIKAFAASVNDYLERTETEKRD